MPHLVHGNAEQFWLSIKNNQMIDVNNDTKAIQHDLHHTPFLGSDKDARVYMQKWGIRWGDQYYQPGNMDASNLLKWMASEPLVENPAQSQQLSLAYVDEKGLPCGLTIYYDVNDPKNWVLGLIKNTQADPKDRRVFLLSNVNLHPYLVDTKQDLVIELVTSHQNALFDECGHPFVKKLLSMALTPSLPYQDESTVHSKLSRVKQLLRCLKTPDDPLMMHDPIAFNAVDLKELMADNYCLDLLERHGIRLPFKVLMQTLGYQENIIQSELRNGVLTTNKEKDQVSLQLLVECLARGYDAEFIDIIRKNQVYRESFLTLSKLGINQDFFPFMSQLDKGSQLPIIHALQDKVLQEICYVFWAKHPEMSKQELETLIEKIKDDRCLSETLLAIDKTNDLPIQKLLALAMNNEALQREALVWEFKEHFGKEGALKKQLLENHSENELKKIRQFFSMIKDAQLKDPVRYYKLLLKKDMDGQLIHLLLPWIREETRGQPAAFVELMNLFYDGIQYGSGMQAESLKKIQDHALRLKAGELYERCYCITYLNNLGFKPYMLDLANQSECFRAILLKVEKEIIAIKPKLLKSAHYKDQEHLLDNYRANMYGIAYDALTNPQFDFRTSIKQEEKVLLASIDPAIESALQKAIVVIENILITLLTLGIANEIKWQKTGNYWFFNRTGSGEKISVLDEKIINLLDDEQESSHEMEM